MIVAELVQVPDVAVKREPSRAVPEMVGGELFWGPYCCADALFSAEPIVLNTETMAARSEAVKAATNTRNVRLGLFMSDPFWLTFSPIECASPSRSQTGLS